jgi:UDP-N-acetylglucosamine acyltransferase
MMMEDIHPTALVSSLAVLGDNVKIGPYCVVGDDVSLDDGVELISHVVVEGSTIIGANTRVFPFASIGHIPQDLKYAGEKSRLEIGRDCTIREQVTINPGTSGGGMLTRVGNNCLLMVGAHVAHDCMIDDHVILVNNATLAGHVKIGEFAIVGGLSAIHQFVRIGRHVMIGGMCGVENDVIPYGSVIGNRAQLIGLNLIGIKRRNFSREIIHELRKAYKQMFTAKDTLNERLAVIAETFAKNEPVMESVDFIQADSSRAICQPKPGNGN